MICYYYSSKLIHVIYFILYNSSYLLFHFLLCLGVAVVHFAVNENEVVAEKRILFTHRNDSMRTTLTSAIFLLLRLR